MYNLAIARQKTQPSAPANRKGVDAVAALLPQLFADGSARWYKYEQMYFLTTWKAGLGVRWAFFYQDPSDFEPALLAELPKLAAPNFR